MKIHNTTSGLSLLAMMKAALAAILFHVRPNDRYRISTLGAGYDVSYSRCSLLSFFLSVFGRRTAAVLVGSPCGW
jgi:hypothetical protein